ncbi:CDP-diacylglycerol--serine O-phosphatidyltransferase [Gimesia sp.]|uniref:CDP-diacylglycerol--serine O-phosphatidyltransferase n=1 Tax=Gimesia sp. TaxID=2024833 RepID=UPI000C53200A|nr:CDP-diacylglycerol--serine O-phosphatidyltransferase [Gimesia sp.]MAX35858.1 CDP-diacylglycerol--serine O-phosphatidyltransferase [Gimesia sp.]|tara:strand:- start:6500 stop:7387 length:888 start_codon:yes stop_codon:yes gene_type:complete
MKKKRKLIAVLPTLLTLGNAACGFGAITYAAKVGPEYLGQAANSGGLTRMLGTSPGLFNSFENQHLFVAAVLIFVAMLFDALDGSAARWANQTSEFGAQLDSLCDAISFGIAPAFLMLQMVQFRTQYHPRLLWVIALLFAVCTILRLARFNVETDEEDTHEGFSGLPSPAAAGVVASFPIAMRGVYKLAETDQASLAKTIADWLIPAVVWTLPWITLAVAALMVSRIHYSHVFNQLFRGQRSRRHVLQLVFSMALVFLVQELAIPVLFCYFAFSSPIRAFWEEVVSGRLYKSKQI